MAQTATHSEKQEESDLANFVEKNRAKIRQCADYYDEYNECTSITGRFQQYFVFGELAECSRWKKDYKNCEKAFDDLNAAAAVIRSEEERLQKRRALHLANDVWERREGPPSNWNEELPDFLQKNQEESFQRLEKAPWANCVIS